MLRTALHILIIVALALQGIAAVGADFAHEQEMQQHCLGHDTETQDYACCPEGATTTSCAVQCSALQSPVMWQIPERAAVQRMHPPARETSIRSRSYTPLNPPPIV
jgi:hypothetical protein